MASSIVDSSTTMTDLLNALVDLPTTPPPLYLDLEGIKLSRHGSISIVELFVLPQNHVYLIDVHVLGGKAFFTARADGKTFKDILESPDIPKVFFDVRNDSDALYSHFKVKLAGVQDIQLLENATRSFNRRCVNGLARCIENDARMSSSEKSIWKAVKVQGQKLFDPLQGGSYEVFNARPMTEEIKKYCVQDVLFLPGLWSVYTAKLSTSWAEEVCTKTLARVALSQTANYNGNGRHMALGPWPQGFSPRPALPKKLEPDFEVGRERMATESDSLTSISRTFGGIRISSGPKFGGSGRRGWSEHSDSSDEDKRLYGRSSGSESSKDFTACSSDDCGNCGHCSY